MHVKSRGIQNISSASTSSPLDSLLFCFKINTVEPRDTSPSSNKQLVKRDDVHEYFCIIIGIRATVT